MLYKDEPQPAEKKAPGRFPCPHGRQEGALVICTAPAEQTTAMKEWLTFEKDGLILTPNFCAKSCPLDVPKPTLPRE